DVVELAFGALFPEQLRTLGARGSTVVGLGAREKRRGYAGATEELPAFVRAIGVIDRHGRFGVRDGGYVGDGALGAAAIGLPDGLFLECAAAAAGSRPDGLLPA